MLPLLQVIDQLPTPVVLTDLSDRLLAASPAARSLLSLPPGVIGNVQLRDRLTAAGVVTLPQHTTIERGDRSFTVIGLQRPLPEHVPADVAALAAEVAHDFNNLLGVIINFATIAMADLGGEHPTAKDLDEVLVAARRAANLTQRLQLMADASRGDTAPKYR